MQLNIMFFVYVSDASAIDCMMPQEDLTGKKQSATWENEALHDNKL